MKEIFPNNHHLKVSIYALTIIGCYPLNFWQNAKLEKLYKYFSWSMLLYYFSFVVRQFIEMINAILTRNGTRIMQNMALTLITFISLVRALICRSKYVLEILRNVDEVEKRILASGEQTIIGIYMNFANYSQFVNRLFLMMGILMAIPFYASPLAEARVYPDLYPLDNITGKVQLRLPISAWVPFDYNKHYLMAFIWEIFDGWIGACFVVCTDILIFSLLIFPIGQLKILQYILTNFDIFADREAAILQLSRSEAGFATIKACITLHKEIISYVKSLDKAMKYLMLLDFMSCSFQMSIIIFEIIMSDLNIPMMITCEFFMSVLTQVFLFYWHANEIIIESINISIAAIDNKWYDESKQVKDLIQILILRAQTPLTISVGPFYSMSTSTAVSLVKAAYSYGMFLRESYLRKIA